MLLNFKFHIFKLCQNSHQLMNENEDIDDTYDYFGSYLKERAE